jgi:L-iditol 2-dehydrogenase
MKALVLRGPNEFAIEEVPVPEPGRSEVLCKVRAVTICGTDSHLIRGDYPGFWPPAYPFTPGHEWAGEIVALGEGAADLGWRVGERIAGTSHDACGFCQMCVEGRYNLCDNYGSMDLHRHHGHNSRGAFAEYAAQGIKSIWRLPDELSFRQGAMLDPASIALHTANRGDIRAGDNVAVIGPGPIGLLAADAACASGAGRVMVVGRGARLQKAADMGFMTVDYSAGDPVEIVRTATGGLGVEVALDCAGVADSFRWGIAMLRRGGRCAAVGIPVDEVEISFQDLVLYEKELVGSRASAGEMHHVIPLVVSGRIRVGDLITHTLALEDFAEGLAIFNERRDGAIKVVFES